MRYNHFTMLPENAFQKRIGFGSSPATLEGGGGGGSTTQTGTTYTSNIPEYLRAPTERMIARGEALTTTGDYEGYDPSARVAPLTKEQQRISQEVYGMETPTQFGAAQTSIGGALGYGTRGAEAAMGVQGGQFTAPELQYFQMAQPGEFTSEAAQRYMSPYQQAVTDIAKREALSEGQRMQAALGAQAAKAGAFGGSRFAVEEGQLYKDLGTRLSDLQVKGSQAAYESAQQQFERDRAGPSGNTEVRGQ